MLLIIRNHISKATTISQWKARQVGSLTRGIHRSRGPVVGGDVVPLSALLVEPEPAPAPLPEVVLPPHPQHRAHPREAVEHHREQRPVPETGQRARVDRREELPRLRRREDRRRALGDDVLRPPDGRSGVHREDLADDEPSPPSMRIAAKCCFTVDPLPPTGGPGTTGRRWPRGGPPGRRPHRLGAARPLLQPPSAPAPAATRRWRAGSPSTGGP